MQTAETPQGGRALQSVYYHALHDGIVGIDRVLPVLPSARHRPVAGVCRSAENDREERGVGSMRIRPDHLVGSERRDPGLAGSNTREIEQDRAFLSPGDAVKAALDLGAVPMLLLSLSGSSQAAS